MAQGALTEPEFRISSTGKRLSLAVFTRFHPSIGGIETVSELLAREWIAAGHQVTIVTDVDSERAVEGAVPFTVLHRPRAAQLFRVVRNCDLVVHHNISLKALWPVLLTRKPLVAVNHDRYFPRGLRRRPWQEQAKVWVARRWAHSLCVSHATQQSVGCKGPVVHNMYDDSHFRFTGERRSRDLVFLGRLVSDKGVTVLLDALDELTRRGLTPSLTIVGEGPERLEIERKICKYGLEKQVLLVGRQSRDDVVRILNRHTIMVIPSVFDEGFGVVALEGAACGCVVVGSESGGLPEAIGPCGLVFPKHDHRRLACELGELLENPDQLNRYRQASSAHLAQHRPASVAQKYIDYFRAVLSGAAT